MKKKIQKTNNFIIIIFILFFVQNLFAQKDLERQKAKLIYTFPKYLRYKKINEHIELGVLGGSQQLLKSLKRYEKRPWKYPYGKSFNTIYILEPKLIKEFKINMLYVGTKFKKHLPEIIDYAKRNNIVVVSDEWEMKKLIMFNFVIKDKNINYEVNSSNLNESGVKVSEEIIKSDAIIIDDRYLFKESEKDLRIEQEKVRIQKEELKMQKVKLKAQNNKLKRQKDKINTQENEIDTQQKLIDVREKMIDNQEENLKSLQEKNKKQIIENEEQTKKLEKQTKKLGKQTKILYEKEIAINEQSLKLNEKHDEVEKQNKILVQQQKSIHERKNIISKQKIKIETQTVIIKTQQNILLVVGTLLGFIIILSFFLFRSLKIQKRQNKQLVKQKKEITKRNRQIQNSIIYAKKIQTAIITPIEIIKLYLPEHFIMFRPRDIVSGDFYWTAKKNNKLIVAAVDCTGHGVPGAFMSMLGITFLNQIIAESNFKNIHADQILNQLREKIKTSLRQTGKENEAKDGMDIALCIIDKNNMKLEFAGAQNPLIIIRDEKIIEYKGDIMPIGISYFEQPFKNHEIEIRKNDIIYIYSDGYADQFNWKTRRRFYSANLKQLFLKVNKYNLKKQKEIFENTFDKWKGDFKQIDDVLLIGMKI